MTDEDEPETPRERMAFNIGIVVFVVLLIGERPGLATAESFLEAG